jgi:cell wall-associated NlpC family hydrolase
MAYRLTRRVRTAAVAAGLIGAAIVVPTVASAAPHATPPKPTIDSVQQQLGNLALKSDQLVEQYNQANNAYHATKAAATKAAARYRIVAARLAKSQEQLASSAAAQYEGGSFSAAGALLSSDSGSSYLDQLDTLSMLSSHNAQVVSSFAATQKRAKDAKNQAADLFAEAKDKFNAVSTQRTKTQQQIDKYTKLLSSLNEQQRAIWAASMNPTVPQAQITQVSSKVSLGHIVSAQARTAVKFALAQVNKPYVYGAAGPSSYDCSGLTMMAYHAAGISLPHSAADQYNYGHHVAANALEPGDLMFYYQPIGHVTIYIGDGMMVSAPQTGENVKVIPANTAGDYTGATRLVG